MVAESLINLGRNISFFTARGPAHTFTYGRWRVSRWLDRRATRAFDVDTRDLLASLDLEAVTREQNRESALLKLADHFRARSQPVFFFNERDIHNRIERIPTEQKTQTIRAAKQICENIFDLRGLGPIKFNDAIDWTGCPNGNVDWRWDLNRHAFFETLGRAFWYTGDECYAQKFRALVCDWLAHNPARLDHPNWNSAFEVAFRINVWVWALYYFRQARAFDTELCHKLIAGLVTHGRYLDAHLELYIPNNHLLLEAKALAFLGILFPEFKQAKRWRERGLNLLERQVAEQVCTDGVHGERTTLYQRVIAGELLELLVLMDNNRIPASANLVERFAKMYEFELALAKPDGSFPLLGDSAAVDTHLRFSASSGGALFCKRDDLNSRARSWQEADYWLLKDVNERDSASAPSPTRNAQAAKSSAFPVGGYYVMRAGQGAAAHYLVFDCGPFGLEALPNHGHADALSFELYALGQTLLVDPGFYSATLGLEWRNFFRGTKSHNTLVVDGLDQSHLMDARRVYRPARASCLSWISNDGFDFVDGTHNGYARLAQPITHRRQILFAKPHYWVVVDVLTGRGKHTFDLYFHMLPGAQTIVAPGSKMVRVENQGAAGLAVLSISDANWQSEIVTGATNPIQGWVSFLSGEMIPAPVLRLRCEAETPTQICTVLYPYRIGAEPKITVAPLHVEGRADTDPTLTALRIETSEQVDYLIIDRAISKARVEFKSHPKVTRALGNRRVIA